MQPLLLGVLLGFSVIGAKLPLAPNTGEGTWAPLLLGNREQLWSQQPSHARPLSGQGVTEPCNQWGWSHLGMVYALASAYVVGLGKGVLALAVLVGCVASWLHWRLGGVVSRSSGLPTPDTKELIASAASHSGGKAAGLYLCIGPVLGIPRDPLWSGDTGRPWPRLAAQQRPFHHKDIEEKSTKDDGIFSILFFYCSIRSPCPVCHSFQISFN